MASRKNEAQRAVEDGFAGLLDALEGLCREHADTASNAYRAGKQERYREMDDLLQNTRGVKREAQQLWDRWRGSKLPE